MACIRLSIAGSQVSLSSIPSMPISVLNATDRLKRVQIINLRSKSGWVVDRSWLVDLANMGVGKTCRSVVRFDGFRELQSLHICSN